MISQVWRICKVQNFFTFTKKNVIDYGGFDQTDMTLKYNIVDHNHKSGTA